MSGPEAPQLTFGEWRELLDELNGELEGELREGTQYVLYVVGGMAMGALLDWRVTMDVDVVGPDVPKPVLKAAAVVAKKHGVLPNWINNQVADFVDVDLPYDAFQPLYSNRNIHVLGAKPEYLLAMKLMAGRDKDIPDLVFLAASTGSYTSDALLAVWDKVYATNAACISHRPFVETVCADIAPLARASRDGEDISEGWRCSRGLVAHRP